MRETISSKICDQIGDRFDDIQALNKLINHLFAYQTRFQCDFQYDFRCAFRVSNSNLAEHTTKQLSERGTHDDRVI